MNFIPLEGGNDNKKKGHFKQNTKKGRIIIRNLSFKATEDNVKEHFAKFGDVQEVRLLKKPDGKLVGCGFVQFAKVPDAAKAIKECNAKPLLGRQIAVDWAIPKVQYAAQSGNAKKDSAEVSVKEEVEEKETKEEVDNEEEADEGSDDEVDSDEDEEEENEEDENEEEDEMDDEEDAEEESDEEKGKGKSWQGDDSGYEKPSDVNEGKTVFIRNLDFSTTEDSLKKFVEQFGPSHYALLCMDPVMERPRGTAFVKFKSPESAQKCIEASENGLLLDGRQINVMLAMSRQDLATKAAEDKKNKKKDSRNLFLAREGLVRPGTRAAKDVSASDMAKRQQVEAWKRQMLRNLHMYISKERLCIHNLPLSYTDKQLKSLFAKHAPKGAKITEARVMRDLRKLDENNKPVSKGYGFVTFEQHEHALIVLRTLNNNPDIFNPNKRPIVEFSVENRAALRAKDKRTEKSKEMRDAKKNQVISTPFNGKVAGMSQSAAGDPKEFMGAKADPKVKGLPSHMGPKIRHKKRGTATESGERKPKITRKMLKDPAKRKRKMPEQQDMPAKKRKNSGRKQTVTKFDRMVDDYKRKTTIPSTQQKKWFD